MYIRIVNELQTNLKENLNSGTGDMFFFKYQIAVRFPHD